jgi:hypothetical protein
VLLFLSDLLFIKAGDRLCDYLPEVFQILKEHLGGKVFFFL